MEGVVVDGTARYRQHNDAKWPPEPRQHFSPSETSRSSNEVVGGRSPVESVPPGRSMFALPAPGPRSDLSTLLNKSRDTRQESPVAEQRRHSWKMPTERPSLPSLRTVLGDRMTSPPKTPSPQSALSRPSPSQMAFDTMSAETYPNKKQRTESFDYLPRPYAVETGSNSSISSSAPLEPAHNHYLARQDHASHFFGARSERNDDYRKSLPPLPTPGSTTSQTSMRAYPNSQNTNSSDAHTRFEEPTVHRRRSDAGAAAVVQPRAAPNYASDRRERGSFGQEFREKPTSERPVSRHATVTGSGAYSSSSSREGELAGSRPSGDGWYPNPAEEGAPHARENHYLEQANRSPTQLRPVYPAVSYQPNQAPIPMMLPNFYDLRHPRSRKRSNLPKQSTEIMKRWFEENLTNPYPSEEQKAVFSQATGISMTQVSNWFINHRRRCPELQYIRERSRTERENDGQD